MNAARFLCARLALGLALAMPLVAPAQSQAYPAKSVRIVVPFAPGGAVDAVSRIVGGRMSEQMGIPFVIENKPGASANLGADLVAKAAPDGATVLMGANGLATNMTLFRNLPFDTLRDFAPIARVGYAPLVLVVPPSLGVNSLRELIALGKAQPGKLNYGSSGNGGSGHLASELFTRAAGLDVLHLPYKGGAPAIADLIGGRLTFMIINPLEAAPHVPTQRLRALAVAADKRIAPLPDTPTFTEAGLSGFEASVWWGLAAPAKTPRELTARLTAEALRALADEGVRDKLEKLGAVVAPQDGEQFRTFLAREIDKWSGVIRAANIRAD